MLTTSEIALWSNRVTTDGLVYTREAVEGVVNDVNNAERAMRGTVNHDLSCMPFRKAVGARLIEESGCHGAEITMTFGEEHHLHMKELPESALVFVQWTEQPRPFTRIGRESSEEGTKVTVDLGDLGGHEQYEVFLEELEAIKGVVPGNLMGRHSVDPAPIIELVLSNWESLCAVAGSTWLLNRVRKFVTGVTDELFARRVEPTCDLIEAKLAAVRRSFSRARGRADEAIDLVLVMSWDEIELVLLVRAAGASEDRRLSLDRLGPSLDRYGPLLEGADSVVFSLSEDGDWQFEYATLTDGNVIGTRACYNRTLEQLRAIGRARRAEAEGAPSTGSSGHEAD